jgi:hypothetical protein
MKDEYDFSGGTRGKFYRPNSRVRLPYHRASQSWFDDVAVAGKWWQPEFWREPEYLASSPWSEERLESAFRVLTKLYSESEAKAAFGWVLEKDTAERSRRMDRLVWRLLACPMRPDLSPLLRLGFDAVDADVMSHSQLVRRLRADVPHEFNSARFELRCLAAFRNAGIDVSYEPSAAAGENPDFRLRLPGDRLVYVDAKHAEEGTWAKEEQNWFWRLSMPQVDHLEPSARPISAHVRLTERFQELQDTEDGRSFLRANIDRIAANLADSKLRLASSQGPFPAVAIVDGLLEVKVMGPPGHASTGSMMGVPTDSRREVARVVRGAVARGAMQIPPDDLSLVLLDPGMHAPSHLLVEEVRRWMGAEGAGYRQLVGVLVMAEVLIEPEPGVLGRLEQIVPVWRDEAPSWIQDGPWQDLSEALAARDMEALARRYTDVGGDREHGNFPRSATG